MASEREDDDLLSEDEHYAMGLTGELADVLGRIVGQGCTREADLAEACSHIHVIQHMVLAQAAARAYPDQYRLLGEVLPEHVRAELAARFGAPR